MPKLACALSLLAALLAGATSADETGALRGQLILEGKVPELKEILGAGGKPVPDESLLVDPESRGIANVVVTLIAKPGDKPPPAPKADPAAPVRLTLFNNRFQPRIVLMRAGQRLAIDNVDPEARHAKCDLGTNTSFNLLVDRGKSREVALPEAEKLPARLSSSLDMSMRGYLVVSDHPYTAVSDRSGKFEIKDIPPGDWTFRVWQERTGYVEAVELAGKKARWIKGQFSHKITPGENDLGAITVAREEFVD